MTCQEVADLGARAPGGDRGESRTSPDAASEIVVQVQDYDAFAEALTREVGSPVEAQGGAPVPAIG